ncbi:DinB family protein [Lutimonas sp.]|uniref:DinB family protein n=1 Tax=Lutimonas sp. TaxID=1872403 RepID=UPI003D9B8AA1
MEKLFETAVFSRKALLNILESKSYDELVEIPENFKNSIFWNVAHLLVTQQLLFYKLSGLELRIDKEMVRKYGKGSLATEDVDAADIEYIKKHLVVAMEQTVKDYYEGVFSGFTPYMTSTGIELKNIEDVVSFSAFHDGIHLGVVLSLKKIV